MVHLAGKAELGAWEGYIQAQVMGSGVSCVLGMVCFVNCVASCYTYK